MLNETRALVEVLQVILYITLILYLIQLFYNLLCILLQDMIGDDRNNINNSLEDTL